MLVNRNHDDHHEGGEGMQARLGNNAEVNPASTVKYHQQRI